MKFRVIVFSILFFIVNIIANAQNLEIEWEKRFDSQNPDMFNAVIEDINSGFTVAGSVFPEGKLDQDFWLVHFNNTGEIIWSKSYGTVFNERALSIAQFSDGGYILAGETVNNEKIKHSFLVKTDDQGIELWQKKLEDIGNIELHNVITSDDFSFIVSGTKMNDDKTQNIWLAQFSGEGEMIWEKVFGDSKTAEGESLRKLPDGGFVVAARVSDIGIPNSDLWLFRFDKNGEKMWDNRIKSEGVNIWPECVCCSPDKNIVVVGWYGTCMNDITSENPIFDYDLFLSKISPDGKVIWTKNIDSEGSEGGYATVVRPDGNILVAGKKETSFLGRVGNWLLLTNQEGIVVEELVIPNLFNSDKVAAIINSADGGFVIVGPGEMDPELRVSDGWIKKFKAF